jgi:hypothetical protein
VMSELADESLLPPPALPKSEKSRQPRQSQNRGGRPRTDQRQKK